MNRPIPVLVLALSLILAGSLLAWWVQTAGGSITIKDVRWVEPSGRQLSGLLYIPPGASADEPAPGILAIHGYINSRETQAGFAIEFARRGYVVLAADQTGHGFSDPPALAAGFGGPAALAYLRSLDFVDPDNIGLEGHSMGGWAVGLAATANPEGYRAMVLAGSSTGSFGVPEGTPEWPRNLAVVFSRWDEFSDTMWDTPRAADIGTTPKLKQLFGMDRDVPIGVVHGSIADGTGRILYQPRTNHPGDHFSREAIGNAIDWFGMTLDGAGDLPASDQIWYWKEFGNLVAAIGMVLLLFPVGVLLLRTRYFSDLRTAPAPTTGTGGWGWWIAAAVTALLGPLTLLRFKDLPGVIGFEPNSLFPQSITNGVIAWTTALGLITSLLLLGWHFGLNRKKGGNTDQYGLTWHRGLSLRRIGKSVLLAFLIVLAAYLTLAAVAFIFTTDFRFWVFAIKPMSRVHLRMALVYFFPFAFYFLILNTALFAQLRRDDWTMGRAIAANLLILVSGYLGLYLYQYVPLVTGGTLATPNEPLWIIISYQLLPLMTIVALVLTFFNRQTGTVYVGGILSAALIAWIVVASQATHVAL